MRILLVHPGHPAIERERIDRLVEHLRASGHTVALSFDPGRLSRPWSCWIEQELRRAEALLLAEPHAWWSAADPALVEHVGLVQREHMGSVARLCWTERGGPAELEPLPRFNPPREWPALRAWLERPSTPPRREPPVLELADLERSSPSLARWLEQVWTRILDRAPSATTLLGLLAIAREPLPIVFIREQVPDSVYTDTCTLAAELVVVDTQAGTMSLRHPAIAAWIHAELEDDVAGLALHLLFALDLVARRSSDSFAAAYLERHRARHAEQAKRGAVGPDWIADIGKLLQYLRSRGPIELEQRLAELADDLLAGDHAQALLRVLEPWAHLLRSEPESLPDLLWTGLLGEGWTLEQLRMLTWPQGRMPALRFRFPLVHRPRWKRGFAGTDKEVRGCAITSDGVNVLMISGGVLSVWSTETVEELVRIERDSTFRTCAMTLDGRWAVTASYGDQVALWDLAERSCVDAFDAGSVLSLAIDPAGKRVLIGCDDGRVLLWTPSAKLVTLGRHDDRCTSVAISPDGKLGLSGGADHLARLWRLSEPRLLHELRGHEHSILALGFDPTGTRAFTLSYMEGRRWPLEGGPADLVYPSRPGIVRAGSTTYERELVVAQSNGRLELWPVDGSEVRSVQAHPAEVLGCAITPDGRWLVSCGDDGVAKLWARGQIEDGGGEDWQSRLRAGVIDPTGSVVAIASGSGHLILLELASNRVVHRFEGGASIRALAWIDERRLVSVGSDRRVCSWSRDRLSPERSLELGSDWLRCVASSPDRRSIALAGDDKRVYLIDLDDDEPRRLDKHEAWIYACAFSPSGDELLSGDTHGELSCWSLSEGRRRTRLSCQTGRINAIVPSSERLVYVAGTGGTIELWDTHAGKRLASQVAHPRASIEGLALGRDDRVLASVGGDGVLRLWATGPQLRPLGQLRGPTSFSCVSLVGDTLFAGDEFGNPWVLDVEWDRLLSS